MYVVGLWLYVYVQYVHSMYSTCAKIPRQLLAAGFIWLWLAGAALALDTLKCGRLEHRCQDSRRRPFSASLQIPKLHLHHGNVPMRDAGAWRQGSLWGLLCSNKTINL
jgi:hypothetical protein